MDRLRYLGLRVSSRIWRWLRRWTFSGFFVLSGLLATASLGLDTNLSTAYQAFTLLAALAAIALVSALFFRPKLKLARALPRFGTAGEPLRYGVRVENLGTRLERGLSLSDEPPDPRPTLAEFRARADAPEATRLERFSGDARWRALVWQNRSITFAETPLPDLPPGGACEVLVELTPAKRGLLRLDGLSTAKPDVFGLYRALRRGGEPQTVLVLPKRHPVPRLAFAGSRKYQPGGVAMASSVGDSQEFASLRDYRPGDPLRRIHWKSWARTGKPVVKEYEDEFFVRHALVLDTFREGDALFEDAVSAAASFACSVMTQESLLDLLFVGDRAHCVTAGRGLGGIERMLEILACVEPSRGTEFGALHAAVLRRSRDLSGCVCVLLGTDEPRLALVRDLRGRGVPVLALVVVEPGRAVPEEARRLGISPLESGKLAEGLAALTEGLAALTEGLAALR